MPTLLVVDDQPGIRHLFQEVFHDIGIRVLTAASGVEALRWLQAECPDLMLLDLKLPGEDSPFILQQARRLRSNLPIVLMTAYYEGEFPWEAVMQAGVLTILRKPFDILEVRRLVLDCLALPLACEA